MKRFCLRLFFLLLALGLCNRISAIGHLKSPSLPDTLSFCQEKVPLEEEDVYERLDREVLVNMYWQSNQFLLFKRANRWFPIIEAILKEEGVPDDFKFLALIESSFLNAQSGAGAGGFWQILKGTATDQGLEINKYVDERLNLEKATRVACTILKRSYDKYGSWTLAAAAYNTGQGNINYHWRTQGSHSYYNLHLPVETLRYVFRILAEKIIFADPLKYGYSIDEKDLYQPYKTRCVKVDTSIKCLFAFAKEHKVLYKDFKMLNPWLIERELPVKEGRVYKIILPYDEMTFTGWQEEALLNENGIVKALPKVSIVPKKMQEKLALIGRERKK